MSHTSSSIKASEKKNNNGSIDVELPQDQPPPPIQLQPQTPPNQQYQHQQQPAPYMPMQVQQLQQPIQQQQQYQNQNQQQQVPTFEYYGQQGIPATYYYATATPNQYGAPAGPVFTPKQVAAGDVNANTNAEIFNPNASKYQCCCGCCHSKSGTIAIACWEVFFVMVLIAFSCLQGIGSNGELPMVGDSARFGFAALFDGIGVFFLIIALCSKNHKLLLPYFGCKVIKLSGVLGYSCYTIWYVINEYNRKVKVSAEYMNGKYYVDRITNNNKYIKWNQRDLHIIFTVSTFMVELIFAIWFMYVVKKCYVYFRDLKLSYQGVNFIAQPYQQVAPSVF